VHMVALSWDQKIMPWIYCGPCESIRASINIHGATDDIGHRILRG
jgi:hypothetical protein